MCAADGTRARHDRRLSRHHAAQDGGGGAARETRVLELLNETGAIARRQLESAERAAGGDRRRHGAQRRQVRRLLLQRHRRARRSLHALRAVGRAARGVRRVRPAARDAAVRADVPRRGRRSASTTCSRIRATARWAPHHGMPPGHLPVRSYLAVPVVSRSGEVIGGLFFGHPEAGRLHRARRAARRRRRRRRPASRSTTPACTKRRSSAADERKQLLESERAARAEAERMSAHEGRVPGHAVARAAHAAQRDPRLVAGAAHDGRSDRTSCERGSRPSSATRASQTQLIEDLLDMSRITSGKMRLDVQPVDAGRVHRGGDRDGAAGGRGQGHPARADPRPDGRADLRRPEPAAAGRLEPALERHQVHAEGRHGAGRAASA